MIQTTCRSRPLRGTRLMLLLLAMSWCVAGCSTSPKPTHADPATITRVAQGMVGVPYRLGGATPRQGFDCSGLVHYAHASAGARVPRTTGEQFKSTVPVGRAALRPGDLVFFRLQPRGPVSHVGIYLGDGRFVHAPSTGKSVSLSTLDAPYWRQRFVRGGRFEAPALVAR